MFVTLFATDKCLYSHREGRASHPFVVRGIRGNKLLVQSSEQIVQVNENAYFLEVGSEMRKILGYME